MGEQCNLKELCGLVEGEYFKGGQLVALWLHLCGFCF